MGQYVEKGRENGVDAQHPDYNARHVVYREHVARAEAAAEEVDGQRQQRPPHHRPAQEAHDGGTAAHERGDILRAVHADVEHGEEGQDVGYYDHEVGHREDKHRREVLPQVVAAGAVLAYLRHGVLEEDVDADDHHEDTAYDLQHDAVLLDLRLQHRVEEEGDDGHERIAAGHAHARGEPRTAVLAQRALYAQHGDGPHGDRRSDAHAQAPEQYLDYVYEHSPANNFDGKVRNLIWNIKARPAIWENC